MSATSIDALTDLQMQGVNQKIESALRSDVALISQMGAYIIGAGGKRLRPRLVLISALAHDYKGKHHQNVAAIIEFIHTATLLHDDVVDSSAMRRGQDTANAVWGNEAAVLVGDFLYSRAFEMMVEVGKMRVMEILSAATNTIAAGEVMQLLNIGEVDVSVERYLEVIGAKTAKLFEAATQLGAVLASANAEEEQAMALYGSHLGIAFQLIDDALDYTADSGELGKNAGDDLAEGKPTLPLIYAMQDSDEQTRSMVRNVLAESAEGRQSGSNAKQLQVIVGLVKGSGSIERTYKMAQQHVDAAIESIQSLTPGIYKDGLINIAEQSMARRF
ncbi:octaprenyl diphosphate synthase [Chromatiales bacterium (ex Bugula neritina AB1)]|nr:octaprenyl diphosphate synthase [Chromatiales bacterium (ex Bugula neritina AB1)]